MFFKHVLDSVASIQALLTDKQQNQFYVDEIQRGYEAHLARGNQLNS